MTKQIKYSFQIEAEDADRIKKLPRGVALPERLRTTLRQVLAEAGV